MKKKITILLLFILISSFSSTLMASNRDNSSIEVNKINKLIRKDKFKEAEKILEEVLNYKDKEKIYDIYESAIVELEKKAEYEIMLKVIKKFIKRSPNYQRGEYIPYKQGLVLKRLYRHKESIEAFEKYLSMFNDPFFEDSARESLGEIYFQFGEYQKAYPHLKWCVENMELNNYRIYPALTFIDVCLALEKDDEALKEIKKGIKKYSPQNEDIAEHYLKYSVKRAKYYFIQGNWNKFKKVNQLPTPWYANFLWWRRSRMGIRLKKLNKLAL